MTMHEENQIVRTLLQSLDAHSEGEWNHAERVAVYAVAMGFELEMGASELRTLRFAAVLHDVGKVRLSASVLNKASGLTDEDFVILRSHATLAQEVIGQFEFLKEALPGIRQHHERWDGTGYPEGRVGNEISLMGRIIGVAETYDLLSWGSFYRPAIAPEDAFTEVLRGAGTQFDVDVVHALDRVRRVIQPVGQEP